jgi:hypothetical protein
MCSTYSSSQYQPSYDPLPSHWNYNTKSRTLVKTITKMATNHSKICQKRTHIAIRTCAKDAPIVGTLLLHPVLPHNLLLTLATRNKREVWPQSSLRSPIRGRGPGNSRHLRLSILIFINYYKFLILWTMKLNELYSKKTLSFTISEPWKEAIKGVY